LAAVDNSKATQSKGSGEGLVNLNSMSHNIPFASLYNNSERVGWRPAVIN